MQFFMMILAIFYGILIGVSFVIAVISALLYSCYLIVRNRLWRSG